MMILEMNSPLIAVEREDIEAEIMRTTTLAYIYNRSRSQAT